MLMKNIVENRVLMGTMLFSTSLLYVGFDSEMMAPIINAPKAVENPR